MTDLAVLFREDNLSVAWAKVFLRLMSRGVKEIAPLVVTIDGITNNTVPETAEIRQYLDAELASKSEFQIETVASTIFPKSLWNPRSSQEVLYKRYLKIWPKIKKYPQNRRGTYFKRLVDFENNDKPVNQLQKIINNWNKGLRRHSALQVAVFDPRKDHVRSRMLGFPCLHQVAFTPISTNGRSGLMVTGFYATQYIFEKAYGNYLGLCRLGQFMASQMDLELLGVTCIAAKAELGNYSKSSLKKLGRIVSEAIEAKIEKAQ